MTYSVPPHRAGPIRSVLDALDPSQRIVLTTHLNADGDGTGSAVALAVHLRARGKAAWIINPTPYPAAYRFLVPDKSWVVDASDSGAESLCAEADLAVVLDTGEKARIGRVKPMIDALPRVIVDHHPIGDDPIEGVSFRDPSASATGELVFDLLHEAGGPWPPTVVNGLYVALLTDTGSFRHSNTSPRCHRVAAMLVEAGARPEELYRKVYGDIPIRRLHLLRDSLATLDTTEDGRVSWMTVPAESYQRLEATADDLEGLVDVPRDVEGVEVAMLFRAIRNGGTKVSFRSNGRVDVNLVARSFGGGGHTRAAGAVIREPLETVRPTVVEAVHAEVRRLTAVKGTSHAQEPDRAE